MIPTIIRTACKVETTASRGCVISQATCSARLRPGGQFRIVALTLDLLTSGDRAANGLIRYSDRATCDARLDSLRTLTSLQRRGRPCGLPLEHHPVGHAQ